MKDSNYCMELIKEFEGLHRIRSNGSIEAYEDPVGIWTIGYGSIYHNDLNRPVQEHDAITKAQAERWLKIEVDQAAEDIERLCRVPLTQGMFDALTSFVYNIGIGAFGDSTLLRKLNRGDYEGAAREFDRWVHAGGRVLPGLVIRRNKEEALFRRDGFPNAGTVVASEAQPNATPLAREERAYQEAPLPLPFARSLRQGDVGEDCYILNCALAELEFLRLAPQPNQFSNVTKNAIEVFQRREALSLVDGIVGPETRKALEMALKHKRSRVSAVPTHGVFCRLTRTHTSAYAGLKWCKLEFVDSQQRVVDSLKVVTGSPSRQDFRLWNDPMSFAGNKEPIPQGRYGIGDIDWANGKDNYQASHGEGLGPVWVPLLNQQPDDRGSFGFHADWNWIQYQSCAGSAGCVVTATLDDLKKLVCLLRQYDPRLLVVDWGL